jgi:acyl dehydratase
MLDYQVVKNWDFGEILHTYTQRDVMLYALGVGIGMDPLDMGQLRFVFEKELQTLPTMGSVLGTPGFWWRDPRTGADWVKIVHGEQDVRVLKPLPTSGTLVARNRVVSITDKGSGKGAIAVIVRELAEQQTGELLVESRNVTFLRGDGGFSRQCGISDPSPEQLPAVPERPPDIEVELSSLAHQALLYRLNGDYNVLHADPDVARAAGFPRPILHGLCTYGMAAHAILKSVCNYDARLIQRVAVRFTAPVFPGETVRFQIWRAGARNLHLRARVDARDIVVLNNGVIELAE